MSDIVERLHEAADRVAKRAMGHDTPALISIPRQPTDVDAVVTEAAAEIERLRAEHEVTAADLHAWMKLKAAAEARLAEAVEVMRRVDVFITNGVELGFIRMPDANVPDPAHKTPHLVRAFLAKEGRSDAIRAMEEKP